MKICVIVVVLSERRQGNGWAGGGGGGMLEAARGWGMGGDFSWCLLLCCNCHGSKLFVKTFYTVSVQPEVGACSHMPHEHLSARKLSQAR